MKKNWICHLTAAAGAAALIFLDQWTKFLAVTHLKDQPAIPLIKDVLELQYLENRGAAFGIFQGQKIPLILFTGILILAMMYFYVRIPAGKRFVPFRSLLIVTAAGAIGNFIDRCRLEYVIDFLYFKLIDFPIFNVADCYVTVSIALFAFLILFYYKEEELDFLFHPFRFRRMNDE